jgi:aminoglycoside/choline kinase family phosphotransferase
MRNGCASYDLGSLLCDPYVSLSDADREELLSFYYGLSKQDVDRVAFDNAFWEASAQRLMQALGAYGFLGLEKGLDDFIAHIPAGLDNLLRATGRIRSLPRLREVAEMCRSLYPPKP